VKNSIPYYQVLQIKMRVIQINTTVNTGSTGRIAEDIGRVLINSGHESFIAYGRGNRPSESNLLKIGSYFDIIVHGLQSAVLDRQGFGSRRATVELIRKIDDLEPDVISLYNLHGYYIHIAELFKYLKSIKKPVFWTLFDCWSFTGHCAYFDDIACRKWIEECNNCPKTRKYPSSYLLDQSKRNYHEKDRIFNSLDKLQLIVHSKWLQNLVKQSFLSQIQSHWIPSGIDLDKFKVIQNSHLKESYGLTEKKIVLGVASIWDRRKGLSDFLLLREILPEEYIVVLIGLSARAIKKLPKGIVGLPRTESIDLLAAWYSSASVFVNPTWQDNFPTTNLEALACGTPVITYDTGGSPEAVDSYTGRVVAKGDIKGIYESILFFQMHDQIDLTEKCRERAVNFYNKDDRFSDFVKLMISSTL
jgi:putative colanic acid biosynthesis glycosyltransferase